MDFFDCCPVSQALFMSTLLSIFIGGAPNKAFNSLDMIEISNGEIYRVLLCQVFFNNFPQTVVGALLIFSFRHFERHMGSRKFGAFLFLAFTICLSIQIIVCGLLSAADIELVPSSGPFFCIFAVLPLFYRHIPKTRSSEYLVLGYSMMLSEKSWSYLLAAQLMFSDGVNSVFPALTGLVTGHLYTANALNMQSFRISIVLETLCSTIGGFFNSLVPLGGGNVRRGNRRVSG